METCWKPMKIFCFYRKFSQKVSCDIHMEEDVTVKWEFQQTGEQEGLGSADERGEVKGRNKEGEWTPGSRSASLFTFQPFGQIPHWCNHRLAFEEVLHPEVLTFQHSSMKLLSRDRANSRQSLCCHLIRSHSASSVCFILLFILLTPYCMFPLHPLLMFLRVERMTLATSSFCCCLHLLLLLSTFNISTLHRFIRQMIMTSAFFGCTVAVEAVILTV